jgi:hypothetical protein
MNSAIAAPSPGLTCTCHDAACVMQSDGQNGAPGRGAEASDVGELERRVAVPPSNARTSSLPAFVHA